MDSMLTKLQARFGHHCKSVLQMSALIASQCASMDFAELSDCLHIYRGFLDDGAIACQAEFDRWKHKW